MRSKRSPAHDRKDDLVVQQQKANFLDQQQRTIYRGAAAVLVSGLCLGAGAVLLPMAISFPVDPIDSILLMCRLSIVPGITLMVAIRLVATVRFHSADDNRGSAYSAPSPKLAVKAAFLTNTLEQSVLTIIANGALTSVGTVNAMAYMAVGTALFLVGRIAFYFGYPYGAGGRAFGMVMTMVPPIGAFAWTLTSWIV